MDGPPSYYSNHPLADSVPFLQRPVVLAGSPGVGVGIIGASLCSLTRWPYVEIERAVEHEAARSLAWLMTNEGEAVVSGRCWAHVVRALARQPASVVAVPAIVVAPGPRLNHILEHADVHFITASVDDQVEWLEQRSARDGGRLDWFPSGLSGIPSVEVLHLAGAPVAQRALACHTVRPSAHLRTARRLLKTLTRVRDPLHDSLGPPS